MSSPLLAHNDEHLLVRAMMQETWDLFQGDLSKSDGFAAQSAGKEHPYFTDPTPLP